MALAGKTQVSEEGLSVEKSEEKPAVGEAEASKYMRKKAPESQGEWRGLSDGEHFLALHMGTFLNGDAYRWSAEKDPATRAGGLNLGFTYRIQPFSKLADWNVRGDFLFFTLPEGRPVMLSVLPLLIFPESSSKFPIYFGLGAGPGVYFQQVNSKSYFALAYQLLVGARFFDVMGSTGFFVEGGIKNHLHLLSEGQFNGAFVSVGTIFTF